MIITSPFPLLGTVEVPDGCRTEFENNKVFTVFAKDKNGTEYVLIRDTLHEPGRPQRRWWDPKCQWRLHRKESDGPAFIDPAVGLMAYFKHGKKHRVSGPAFYTATKEQLYYYDGQELSPTLHAIAVKNKSLPKASSVMKLVTDATLATEAARLSSEARQTGKVGRHIIPSNELSELDVASKDSSWRRRGKPELRNDGSFVFSLNCEPLDDTLRCYINVDVTGKILSAQLEIE